MASKTLVMPIPNKKQVLAFQDQHRHVAYGGARGGGKSWFVRWKATLLCVTYPGIKVLITRRTYKELLNNHIEPLKVSLHGIARYNNSEKCFRFPNGSSIWFGYCANEGDLGQYQGAEYDIWFADEAGQFLEDWISKINACVRGVNSFPKRTYYTLNPGGPSHGYFKRVFVDRRFTDKEDPNDYSFIQALCTDNKALMQTQPEYYKDLDKLPPKLRAAWLEGSWDIFEGQFFEEFRDNPEHYNDHRWTHVIAPFDIPKSWPIYHSMDWGYSHPFSIAWWTVDYDGRIYRILEYYGCTGEPNVGLKLPPPVVAAEVQKIESSHPWLKGRTITGPADPAIWNAEYGKSIAENFAECGVYFTKGDHQRIPGWMQVHYRLHFDSDGYPMMQVFSNCKTFIRTMPLQMYSEHKPEDLNTELEDHCPDEVRYFCMSRPIEPTMMPPEDAYVTDIRHTFFDIDREDIRNHPADVGRLEVREL